MAVEIPEAAIEALLSKLVNPNSSLSEKYRVLFSLRNLSGSASHGALLQGRLQLIDTHRLCTPAQDCLSYLAAAQQSHGTHAFFGHVQV